MASEHVQKAIDSLLSARRDLEARRRELEDEVADVERALSALGVMPERREPPDGPTVRDRLLELAQKTAEFTTPDAVEYIYGQRFVDRGKYSTVSSALATLYRDGLLEKPERGRFRGLSLSGDGSSTPPDPAPDDDANNATVGVSRYEGAIQTDSTPPK